VHIWKGVCFANDATGKERVVELLSSSEGMTQREITRELSASERTVRLWISKLKKSGRVATQWGDDLRAPVYVIATPAATASESGASFQEAV